MCLLKKRSRYPGWIWTCVYLTISVCWEREREALDLVTKQAWVECNVRVSTANISLAPQLGNPKRNPPLGRENKSCWAKALRGSQFLESVKHSSGAPASLSLWHYVALPAFVKKCHWGWQDLWHHTHTHTQMYLSMHLHYFITLR